MLHAAADVENLAEAPENDHTPIFPTYPIDWISEAFPQAARPSHGGDPLRVSRAAIAC
jgi:hypothetical protein